MNKRHSKRCRSSYGLRQPGGRLGLVTGSSGSNWLAEPIVLRDQKLTGIRGSEEAVAQELTMMELYYYEVAERMHISGKEALLAFAEFDELKMMLMGLKRFTKTEPFNTMAARQAIAQKLIAAPELTGSLG